MYRINVRGNSGRKYAFCKHWNDPENIAISPREPELGLWEFNRDMKSECESYDDLYESIWYPLNDLVERNNTKSNTKNKVDLER